MNNYPPNPYDSTHQNPLPPRQPPLPHQPFLQWYRDQMRRNPILTGCLTALFAFIVLLLCGIMSIANGGLESLIQSTPTPVIHPVRQTVMHATPTARPQPTATAVPISTEVPPTSQPTPVPITCSGTSVEGVCYNYDSAGGSLVYNPPASFCTYFLCVSTFWTNTNGYVVKCADGKHSHSGGVSGACSRNGGVAATLYQH